MQVKLVSNYRVQVSRVQVSRIVFTPLIAARAICGTIFRRFSPRCNHAQELLLHTRNSRRFSPYAHFSPDDADCSLLPPRHRCYALLSSALS